MALGRHYIGPTDDPVRDAENYMLDQEKETRPVIGYCDFCGEPIYGSNDCYCGDFYISVYDIQVHDECWFDFGEQNRIGG